MKLKRIISVALMLAIALCIAVPAQFGATNVMATGSCGSSAKWTMYSDNILVITESGAINNYDNSSNKAPWAAYYFYSNMSFMQKIVIADGITRVGDYAFYMDSNTDYKVYNITLPESLVEIGNHAFENEGTLEYIAIPQNVTTIGAHAFDGCEDLATVNYYGNPANLTWNVSDSGLPTGCEIHLKGEYESATDVSDFAPYNVVFDLTKNPNSVYPNKKILASYENVHSATFGGAHPYSIKLVDDNNMIWPITNGSR